MDPIATFLAGFVTALSIGLLLRARSVSQQAAAHEAEKERVRGEFETGMEKLRAESVRDREAAVRLEAEVEKIEALRESADKAARERDEFLRLQKEEMQKTFKALSFKALEDSNKSFLDRATERLKPMGDQLKRLEKATSDMEKSRQEAYGSLKNQLGHLHEATEQYRVQAQSLSEALKGSSQARGRIGEMVLRNIAEFAGMTRHCDFIEQETDSSGQRPDMIVNVPDGGQIPVDAKFPLAAFDRALESEDPEERKRHLEQHARDLRTHVVDVSRRDYSQYTTGDSDFTVLFLPGDHLLAAAFEANPGLQEEAFEKRVLITTPVTLVALLRTVALYWRQHQLAENAQEIAEASKDLMARLGTFVDHFSKVGRGLTQSVTAFNKAVGSYERRILPAGRRVSELQDRPDELPTLEEVEADVRGVESAPELEPPAEDEVSQKAENPTLGF